MQKKFYVNFLTRIRGKGNLGKVYSFGQGLAGKIIPGFDYDSSKRMLSIEYLKAIEAISRGLKLPKYEGLSDLFNFKNFKKMPVLLMRDLGSKSLDNLFGEEFDLAMESRKSQLELAKKKGVCIYDPFLSNSVWVPEENQTYFVDPYHWSFLDIPNSKKSQSIPIFNFEDERFSEFEF